jgi:hypothetical protein
MPQCLTFRILVSIRQSKHINHENLPIAYLRCSHRTHSTNAIHDRISERFFPNVIFQTSSASIVHRNRRSIRTLLQPLFTNAIIRPYECYHSCLRTIRSIVHDQAVGSTFLHNGNSPLLPFHHLSFSLKLSFIPIAFLKLQLSRNLVEIWYHALTVFLSI